MDRNPFRLSLLPLPHVALRKESVDRNGDSESRITEDLESLSARRAWIEMLMAAALFAKLRCRSPQGERG